MNELNWLNLDMNVDDIDLEIMQREVDELNLELARLEVEEQTVEARTAIKSTQTMHRDIREIEDTKETEETFTPLPPTPEDSEIDYLSSYHQNQFRSSRSSGPNPDQTAADAALSDPTHPYYKDFTPKFLKIITNDFFDLKNDKWQYMKKPATKDVPGTYQTELSLKMKLKIIRIPENSLKDTVENRKSIFVDADTDKFHWFLYIGGEDFSKSFSNDVIHSTINLLNSYDESELVSFKLKKDCSLKYGHVFSRAWVLLLKKLEISSRNLITLQEKIYQNAGPLDICSTQLAFLKNILMRTMMAILK